MRFFTTKHSSSVQDGMKADDYYLASQYQLMWRKLKKHKLALLGGGILLVIYLVALLCEFLSPYTIAYKNSDYLYACPQRIRILHQGKPHRPFVYALKDEMDPVTWRTTFQPDTEKPLPLQFFAKGEEYEFWGLFKTDRHLFTVKQGTLFLFGTDRLGRDLFTRTLYGARISLSIGLVGVFLGFVLGLTFGGISGYFGGLPDLIIQRVIEFLRSLPTIPLWMVLAAALPANWSSLKVYFGITILLSFIGWTGMARVVRGKLLSIREEDFVMAAIVGGAKDSYIIARHLIPSFLSYVIVSLTLAVPHMILGETALSYLGLGLRPPIVS